MSVWINCVNSNTMAEDPAINPALLNRALKVGGEKTKRATVDKALREFIARREQAQMIELFGTLDWNDEFDYRRERSRR